MTGGPPADNHENTRLIAARQRLTSPTSDRPMTTHEVAEAINAYLWQTRRLVTNVDHRFVAGYEAGRHRWPRTHYRDAFRHVLRVKTDADLSFHRHRNRTRARTTVTDRPQADHARGYAGNPMATEQLTGVHRAADDGQAPDMTRRTVSARDDPWETVELLARLRASAISPGTIEALQSTVFELCCQYSWRDPKELRRDGHVWLDEVTRLLRQSVGLRQHRELLVIAGWLALLIGCVEYDMGHPVGAEATRVAAFQLGQEAGHGEIIAWSWEMSAWFALTQGQYGSVVCAAAAGQAAIGEHTAAVQLIAQEAKARARMNDPVGVRAALERGWSLLDRFPPPHRPDHHFVVDPDKWDFYAMDAYRIAGDDDLAEHHARRVLAPRLAPDGTERTPMRMAEARLTLATIAARAAELEEAVRNGLTALKTDRRSLPSLLMVGTELDTELHHRYPDEHATAEFRDALRSVAPARPRPKPTGPGRNSP